MADYRSKYYAEHFLKTAKEDPAAFWDYIAKLEAFGKKQDKKFEMPGEMINASAHDAVHIQQLRSWIERYQQAKTSEEQETAFDNVQIGAAQALILAGTLKREDPDAYAEIQPMAERLQTLPTRSASSWIEEFQKETKKGEFVPHSTIAKILAARQLANAVRGKRGNIDRAQLSEDVILDRAREIEATRAFKDFMKNDPISVGLVKDGHGGRMEMQFDAYIKSRKDCQDLDPELFGRYQYQYDCETYKDYVRDKGWTEEELRSASPDERTMQAARMVAATVMERRDPGIAFNEKNLNAEALRVAEEPAFRLAMRRPGMVEAVAGGNVTEFLRAGAELAESFSVEEDRRDEPNKEMLYHLRCKLAGSQDRDALTPAEQKKKEQDPRFVAAKEQQRRVEERMQALYDPLSENDRQLIRITATDQEILASCYGNYGEAQNAARREQRERDRQKELWESAWEDGRKEIRSDDQLSEAEKEQKLSKLETDRARQLERGRALNEQRYQINLDGAKAQKNFDKVKEELLGASRQSAKSLPAEQAYLKGRSMEYCRMFAAVEQYHKRYGTEDEKPQDAMNAVAAILEYQDGKESRGGGIRERVDLSMRTLAQITVGTPNERILDEQIKKINQARGLRPGQKGALSKDALYEKVEAPENDLAQKIRNLKFDSSAENEVEAEEEHHLFDDEPKAAAPQEKPRREEPKQVDEDELESVFI